MMTFSSKERNICETRCDMVPNCQFLFNSLCSCWRERFVGFLWGLLGLGGLSYY
jgi:hypothetical protein